MRRPLAFALAALFASNLAHARVSDVSLAYVRGDVEEACAVQVTIEEVEDNLVNLSETLTLDGTPWATFAEIDPTIDSIRKGDSVLFASARFELYAEYDADVVVADEDCATLMGGHTLGFLGSFGEDAGSLVIPDALGLNSVFDGTATIDLQQDGYELESLDGSLSLGTGGTGCGCTSSGPLPAGLPVGLAIAALVLRRRREA